MFSGIVQAVGRIAQVEALGFGKRLTVEAGALGLDDVAIGDSIAIAGACMTVTSRTATQFTVDVSAESLSKTVGLDRPGDVNLEKSLRLGDRIDGHLVSGHVDGTAVVHRFEQRGESWHLELDLPAALAPYCAPKGSIAVDGVSLTINAVEDVRMAGTPACRIAINLIPHTIAVTTLGRLAAGARVNIEVDPLARYVARMLALRER